MSIYEILYCAAGFKFLVSIGRRRGASLQWGTVSPVGLDSSGTKYIVVEGL